MISHSQIDQYLGMIPAIPKIVKACSVALEQGDLVRAADIAANDNALMLYLQDLVNKPIFGFRTHIKEARQLFGVLGLWRAKQVLTSYYTRLLLPKRWEVFALDTRTFQELQAHLMVKWEAVMKEIGCNSGEIAKAASVIPAAIAACEEIFKHDLETLRLLQAQRAISYEEILVKMAGVCFVDIACAVAKKWELSGEMIGFLESLGEKENQEERTVYFRLLLQYELSRPVFVQCGLNGLFAFSAQALPHQIERFYTCMEKIEV